MNTPRVTHRLARMSTALVLTLASLYVPSAASAATYYVAPNGNDSSTCSAAQSAGTPRRTIPAGLACLKAGDTLYVRAGTYVGRINSNQITIPTGTSWSTAVRIAGYPGERVILQAPSGGGVVGLAHSYIQYVIFDNLVFDGAWAGNFGTSVISLWGGANHVRFVNVEVKNSPSQGITVFWGNGLSSDFNEFIDCDVHDNGTEDNLDHGLYISSGNTLVEGCRIYNNKAWGVHIYNGYSGQTANNNIIRNNHLIGNGTTSPNGGGVISGSGSGTLIANNVINGNRDGILICCGTATPSNHKIFNNTIHGNSRWGVEVQKGTGHQIRNNIIRSNAMADTRFLVGVTATNNLSGDPQFVDAAAGDFRLKDASSAIDAGIALAEVPDDFMKVSRPQGSTHDLGAYEYISSTAGVPAPPANLRIGQ
jgi:parallel beta-helix repeat protein